MRQRLSLVLALLLCAFTSFAQQTGTVKGFIYEAANGERMSFTYVFLTGTGYGAQTDANGYFSIIAPVGEYTLASTQYGFDTAKAEVTITNNVVIQKSLRLKRASTGVSLGGITVSQRKQEKRTLVGAAVTSVTPREMKLLPSAGGEPDLAQYLQVTPGVIFTGDQGGQLYVRGGAPSQTGILLDGVTIYNPFHTIGLYSVFETDAIRNVDIYSAGFNAQYGNRTSAILDIKTKDGNKNRTAGKVSVSPIMARIMLEGPISKAKTEDGGSITYLLSAKHSYLNSSSKAIYSALGDPFNNGLPYQFTDLYGKISFNGANGSKLNLFAFNFDDKSSFNRPGTDQAIADFNWKATGAGATFIVSPSGSSTLIDGKFAYSRYKLDYNELNSSDRSTGIDGFEGGINFTNFLSGFSQIKYGIEVSGMHTSLAYPSPYATPANRYSTTLDRRNTLASVYAMWRKNFNERLIIEPGLRVQYYATLNKISPEPRLGVKLNATNNLRFKGAAGIYSQNIVSTKSDRDIVNFFTGFLLSPDQTLYNTKGEQVSANLQRAWHALIGVELDLGDVELNLEPWFKDFTQNIELNRYKGAQNPDGTFNTNDFLVETGKAYGVDLSAKYSKGRTYLWGVFGYQYVERFDGVQTYAPPFDRRFNINLLGSYSLGKRKDIELSARYNMGSPFPFTQTQGFYENLNMTQNGIGTNYLTQNGQVGLLYANEINGGRLSYYHRVDLSAKKRFFLSKNSNLETSLAITNVFSRSNIFYINRLDNTRVYQLPFFPSVNVTWNF
jgi:hypothetical protein